MSQPGNPYPNQPQQPYGEQPVPQQPYGEQQGGYPPVGAPYGDPVAAPPPAPKKSKAGKIVLIVLAVVLVLCCGGGAIAWFAVKDDVTDAVEATKTRVTAPATLAGRPKVTEPQLQAAVDTMIAQMKSTVQNETSTAGGFYGDLQKQDLVMIAAASGLLADPTKELDDAISELGKEMPLSNVATVDAGPLGGEARCGDGKSEGMKLGVCLWADKGSVGMIVMYFKTAAQAKAEFVTMRGQIEQRS
ncbi:YppG family protein [Micromonospora okii]|uniref:YppG family protein n=1 Tax=Micromonospora okii TaxID=1182970 RepID=UPI001E5A2C45|nr:YppG family protein [Micromonospora okii]